MTVADAKRGRGRPNDPRKREALLDAARELLLDQGPDIAMEAIAAKACVAKATLYAKFPDKESIVEAVLRRESDRTITDEQLSESLSMKVDEALTVFGLRYMAFINERRLGGWDRLIAAMAIRHPHMSRRFFDLGPGRGRALLSKIIESGIAKGHIKTESAADAADDLLGLWLGFTALEINLFARDPMSASEITERVSRGVTLFMRLYGVTASKPRRRRS
jgi:TetR/AcrR family transcriptional repressor of mexJK operon